jgi:hypothetical protein
MAKRGRYRLTVKGAHTGVIEHPQFIYRGVHAYHPALADAMLGKAVPGDIRGTVSPKDHNKGGVSGASPYTSWTTDREVAEYHARLFGPGGVVLQFPGGGPGPGDAWRWEPSPDEFEEQEVLLHGARSGATVIRI